MGKKYLMSSAQKRIYVIDQMQDRNITYNIPITMQADKKIDIDLLRKSLKELTAKHDILRTRFDVVNGKMIQIVEDEVDISIEKLKGKKEDFPEIINGFIRPFDLANTPLFRVGIIEDETCPDLSIIITDLHHIIYDGGSMPTFFGDLSRIYNGRTVRKKRIQYKDFSAWHNKLDMSKQEKYWMKEFENGIPQEELPLDYPRSKKQTFTGEMYIESIKGDVNKNIKELSMKFNTTPYMIFLTAFMIWLSKYTRQEEVVVGTPVSGRTHPDVQDMIGMFVNTLVIKGEFNKEDTVSQSINNIKDKFINAYDNQDYPFEKLVEELKVENNPSRNPIFDIMFVYQSGENPTFKFGESILSEYPLKSNVSKFDISFTVSELESEYLFNWEYNTSLFKNSSIKRMSKHFINMLNNILDSVDEKIKNIDYIDDEERNTIFNELNPEKTPYPNDKTIIDIFESQVEVDPEHTALIMSGKEISYGELNAMANATGRRIKELGVGPNDVVGMLMDRSIEMIVGILGVLKAGGAYVPINPDNPLNRTEYTLEDSNAKIVIVLDKNIESIAGKKCIHVDLNEKEYKNINFTTNSRDLAYIIYTSGTTGKPKGVMLENRGMINLTNWLEPFSQLNRDSLVLQKATYTFDASAFEIFPTLLTGGRLQLLSEEENKDYDLMSSIIKNNRVTHAIFIPTMFSALLDYMEINDKKDTLSSLKNISLGGELLTKDLLEKYTRVTGDSWTKLTNLYGPTESTICASGYKVPEDIVNEIIPIGLPIDNTELLIMDGDNLCGIGVPGELCIGGDCLARGYLNREELTSEKFMPHPFKEGERLYRSGDLARWLEDGNIECIGRIDEQVKIRGFRIELNEIQNNLIEKANLQDAVVVPIDYKGDKQLCAYIVSEDELDIKKINDLLSEELPDYMIPAHYMVLDKLPITQNGKLDKKALPMPEITDEKIYIEPKNHEEKIVVDLFKEVLNIEKISTDDNFFDIGGHSLKAMLLVSLIEKNTGKKINLKDIMELKTVENIAAELSGKYEDSYEPILKSDSWEMSSAQKRMYVLNKSGEPNISYNIPIIMKIKGIIDIEKLQYSFNELGRRNEILKTNFKVEGDSFYQVVNEEAAIEIDYLTGKEDDIQNHIEDFVRPFDLDNELLIRVRLLKYGEDEYILMMDMHHTIFDGGSTGKFLDELLDIYNDEKLEEPGLQYRDFSAWHNKMDLKGQEEYWLNEFKDYSLTKVDLVEDEIIGTIDEKPIMFFKLEDLEREKLKDLLSKTGTTEYMLFLTILYIFLNKYSRQDDLVVGTPVTGRTHPDVQDMIGMFVNTLAIRQEVERDESFLKLLEKVKDKVLNGFENQDYPFEKLVEKLNIPRIEGENPLFNTMFTMESQVHSTMKLGDAEIEEYPMTSSEAKFDLLLTVAKEQDYTLFWEYNKNKFKKSTIEYMSKHFMAILEDILNEPSKNIGDIETLDEDEFNRIFYDFNDTKKEYPREKNIMDLFEEQVFKYPNKDALVMDRERITYEELDDLSNYYAEKIHDFNIEENGFIGIIADRKIETVVGIVSILKAGYAYLPIDPSSPIENTKFILENSNCKLVLLEDDTDERVPENIDTLELKSGEFNLKTDWKYERNKNGEDLAYLMYTSGTTGTPKGTMIKHRSISRLVKNTNYMDFNENTRLLQIGSLTFDAATYEIWGPLLNGGTVFIIDSETISDADLFRNAIEEYDIRHMFITTALFNQMVSINPKEFDNLDYLFVGGEKMSSEHGKLFRSYNKKTKFFNIYGPTESTTFALYYPIVGELEGNVPIGRPISNTTAYVFNENRICGIGMPGELYLGGDGLAKGYLSNDELNKRSFIKNPYDEDEVLYRTGDLVRQLESGDIEYLGRIDKQVKIHGFRIELEGITTELLKLENIVGATTVIKEKDNEKILCSYIVSNGNIDIGEIKTNLQMNLPKYMIPSSIMVIDEIPMNKNGKVNERLLPEPTIQVQNEYIAPMDEKEKALAKTISETIGVKQVGIEDNFFELGGDSIKAISIVSKLRELGWEITARDIMQGGNIKNISSNIKKSSISISQDEIVGEVELTPIQKLFYDYSLNTPNHFNQSFILKSGDRINRVYLEKTIFKLLGHHDILRASFKDGIQNILSTEDTGKIEIQEYDLMDISEEDIQFRIDELGNIIQRDIDIEKGPLYKFAIFKTKDKDYFLMVIHHLVIDAVSWRIIIEDLNNIYNSYLKNTTIILPGKTISFKDWSSNLKRYSETENILKELPYWKNIDSKIDNIPKIEFIDELDRRESSVLLSKEDTNKLIKASTIYKVEVKDLLMTSVVRGISKNIKSHIVGITLEGHGREDLDINIPIDRTIGWFTSIYPTVFDNIGKDLLSDIENIKTILEEIPSFGLGYGLLTNYGNKIKNRTLDISFNYLGDFGSVGEGNSDGFNIAKMPHGDSMAANNHFGSPISINGVIMDDVLSLTTTCNLKTKNNALIDNITNSIKDELLNILDEDMISQIGYSKKLYDLNNPLSKYIWEKFQLENLVVEGEINNKNTNILYIKGLNESIYGELLKSLKGNVKFVDLPDYILDLEYYYNDEDIYKNNLLDNIDIDSMDYLTLPVIESYNPTALQCGYLGKGFKAVVRQEVILNGIYDKDEIIDTIKSIIKDYPILRSTYLEEDNRFVINEHEYTEDWKVPYLDLSYENEIVEEKVEGLLDSEEIFSNEQLLSTIVVTKNSERQFRVNIIISHSIWDKMSTTIFQEILESRLEEKSILESEIKTGSSYAIEIEQRLKSKDAYKFIEKYRLDDFVKNIMEITDRNRSNPVLKSELAIVELEDNLLKFYKENPWDILTAIFQTIALENGFISSRDEELPLVVLQENRRNMKNDYNKAFGAYLDCIPVIVQGEKQTLYDEISKEVEIFKKDKNTFKFSILDLFNKIDPKLEIDKMLSINNQSIFGLDYESLMEMKNIVSNNELQGYELVVNSYEDSLVLIYPVTNKSTKNIGEEIQRLCNKISENI